MAFSPEEKRRNGRGKESRTSVSRSEASSSNLSSKLGGERPPPPYASLLFKSIGDPREVPPRRYRMLAKLWTGSSGRRSFRIAMATRENRASLFAMFVCRRLRRIQRVFVHVRSFAGHSTKSRNYERSTRETRRRDFKSRTRSDDYLRMCVNTSYASIPLRYLVIQIN